MSDAGVTKKDPSDIRREVRDGYAKVARGNGCCCGPSSSCCGSLTATDISKALGYSEKELSALPEGANLGLGCGNPVALASLKPGETVLDLGSGAGVDCFLAAKKVGPAGKVIGVDMTPEMVEKARANARKSGYDNVGFRLGEIEHLPVADSSVDCIISNCVINLSPDKQQVFREALRVLRPGGRLMVSDIVLAAPLPKPLLDSVAAYVGCISGASLKTDYLTMIAAAGFTGIAVVSEGRFPVELPASDPTLQAMVRESGMPPDQLRQAAAALRSIAVTGTKPRPEA